METITKIDGREVVSYSTKETAQFIREALKTAFPGVKFSVRTEYFSMGSATRVRWDDGPTTPEVDRITDRFTSRGFDGMTDSTTYHSQIVDSKEVQYSGFVTTSRHISDELRAMAERKAAIIGCDNVWEVLHNLRPNGVRVTLKPEAYA